MTKIANGIGMDTTTGQFEILNAGDTLQLPGNLQFAGSAPGIAAGAGAGGSPTISLLGVNNGGTITLVPGLGSTGSAIIATVTYTTTFPTDSAVSLVPAGLSSAQINGISAIYVNATASGFTINSTTSALSAGTTFIWNYTTVGW